MNAYKVYVKVFAFATPTIPDAKNFVLSFINVCFVREIQEGLHLNHI